MDIQTERDPGHCTNTADDRKQETKGGVCTVHMYQNSGQRQRLRPISVVTVSTIACHVFPCTRE